VTKVMTITEYLLEELNRRARERGEDIELVYEKERLRPRLATREGKVVQLKGKEGQGEC
jgi:hypothetical protein